VKSPHFEIARVLAHLDHVSRLAPDLFNSLHKASSVESAEQPHEEKDISTIH
jgi:hypothetical protein